jgi:peroxiredoxin
LRARGIVAAAALLALSAAACRKPEAVEPPERAPAKAEAPAAPAFELKGLGGGTVRLEDLRGKVALVDFWATFCEPCRESMPELQALYARRKGQGFTVLGVSMDAYPGEVGAFVKALKVDYPIALDPENRTRAPWGVRGLPTAVLLDREGRIRRRWLGTDESAAREMEEAVAALLKEEAR